jgi:hypothetical protein
MINGIPPQHWFASMLGVCVMLWTTVNIMQMQKLETQYNAKYTTLHKKEEASSKGHPSNKNDDAVTSGVVWCPIHEKHALHK